MGFQVGDVNSNYNGSFQIKTAAGITGSSRYFPEINDDRSSNPNLSPLNEIIQDLKRKNVVASAASGGPQLALDSRSDPWGSSEAAFGVADDGVTVSFSSNDRLSTLSGPRHANLVASPQQKQQHAENNDPSIEKLPPHITDDPDTNANSTNHRQKSRLNPWLNAPPPKHAEELLKVTPQLRIISSSSTDMNVAGISASNNVFGMVLSSTPFHHHFNPMNNKLDSSNNHNNNAGYNGKNTASTSASSSNSGSTSSDYKASLMRDRSNHQAATELASLLWICAHEMSLEDYGRVESKTFTSVFALVHSKDNLGRRMAGLAALDALIDAPSADEERKSIKFANTLSGGLRSARGNYEFLSAVSKALGHMATRTANVDFVESEVTRALEWLRTDRSDRRYVYCCNL